MSKSVKDPKGTIDLLDDPAAARKKIMSAETDSLASVNYDIENQPGISNLIEIYANFTDQSIKEAEAEFKGSERYGDLKSKVADVVCAFLDEIQAKYADVSDEQVVDLLRAGEPLANQIANKTLDRFERALKLKSKDKQKGRANSYNKLPRVEFGDFAKLDIRIGTVVSAEEIPESDKLIKLMVDVGEDQPRQIITGMRQFYSPDEFLGQQVTVLCNLAPRTMMGMESQGMLIAAETDQGPVLLHPGKEVDDGSGIE